MRLDPSFQVKKSRRQSVEVFKKNCKGYPQPHELESVGVEIPITVNFAHVLREQAVLNDVLSIVSKKVGSKAIILEKVTLSFISNIGCYLQLGKSNRADNKVCLTRSLTMPRCVSLLIRRSHSRRKIS